MEKVFEEVGSWVGGSLLYRLGCSVRLPLGLCWCATKLQTGWNAAVLSQQRWQFWERGGRMSPPLLYIQSTQCFCHRKLPLSLKLYNFAKAWELQPRKSARPIFLPRDRSLLCGFSCVLLFLDSFVPNSGAFHQFPWETVMRSDELCGKFLLIWCLHFPLSSCH